MDETYACSSILSFMHACCQSGTRGVTNPSEFRNDIQYVCMQQAFLLYGWGGWGEMRHFDALTGRHTHVWSASHLQEFTLYLFSVFSFIAMKTARTVRAESKTTEPKHNNNICYYLWLEGHYIALLTLTLHYIYIYIYILLFRVD